MQELRSPIDIVWLAETEAACRRRLRDRPDDLAARMRLAWCLFVHATHQAGEERLLSEMLSNGERPAAPARAAPRAARDHDAVHLLDDCLRQVNIVAELSASPEHRADAQKLRGLVQLATGGHGMSLVEEQAARALQELLQAILEDAPEGERRLN